MYSESISLKKIFKLGTQHSLCPTELNTFSNHYNNNFTMSVCTQIFLMHQAMAFYEITGSEQRNNCVSMAILDTPSTQHQANFSTVTSRFCETFLTS